MPYQIKKYDGTPLVTLADFQYNDTACPIVLLGKHVTNYGQIVAEDFVHLLENFSSPTPPGLPSRLGEPLIGQLWYDTMNRKLRVRAPTGNWDVVGSTNSGSVPPTPPNMGDLWLDTSTDPAKLKVYNGSKWQLAASSASVSTIATNGSFETGEFGDLAGENYFNTTSLGNNAEPQVGDLWWDFGTKQFKIYNGNIWDWCGPMMDKDRDTFISPEGLKKNGSIIDVISGNPTMSGEDDDILHFVCKGKEEFQVTKNNTARFITTGALKLHSGTIAQRPSTSLVELGMVRYNSEQNRFEGTIANGANIVWTGLGGVIDVDQDTFISAERDPKKDYTTNTDPGYDSDSIDIFNRGKLSARFIPTGDLIFYNKGFIQLPNGNSNQRPPFNVDAVATDPTTTNHTNFGNQAVAEGMMRYNSERDKGNGMVEFYIAGSWVGIKNPKPGFSGDVEVSSCIRQYFNHDDLLQVIVGTDGVINTTNKTIAFSNATMKKYNINVGSRLLPVTHNINNPYVITQVYDDCRNAIMADEVILWDANKLFIEMSSFMTQVSGAWVLSSSGPGPTGISGFVPTDIDGNTVNGAVKKWCVVVTG